jgi:hypothetical protein
MSQENHALLNSVLKALKSFQLNQVTLQGAFDHRDVPKAFCVTEAVWRIQRLSR